MKIEFKTGKVGELKSDAVVNADDYLIAGNEIVIKVDEVEGKIPYEQLQVLIDDEPITLTWNGSSISIVFSNKKHADFIKNLIKVNKIKNRFNKFFKH